MDRIDKVSYQPFFVDSAATHSHFFLEDIPLFVTDMTSMPPLTSSTPSSQVPIDPQAGTIDLKSLEKQYQALWASQRLFEVNAPSLPQTAHLTPAQLQETFPKWFGNFPYPYMTGPLHLGHAFTISKVEFAAGYQRMLGKRVLFPHGFHVSGSVIKVR